MATEAKSIIEKLQLMAHPEGGYFKEIYRSNEIIPQSSLPKRYKSERTFFNINILFARRESGFSFS